MRFGLEGSGWRTEFQSADAKESCDSYAKRIETFLKEEANAGVFKTSV